MSPFVFSDFPKDIPTWQGTVLVDDDGTIFAPLYYCPSGEVKGLFHASQDGEPIHEHQGHAFVRLGWLRENYPEESAAWGGIASRVASHCKA